MASGRKKSHEEFVQEIFEIVGDEYTVLGKYVNADTMIEMRHNKCNSSWLVRPYSFTGKKPNRCSECAILENANNQRKTLKQFVAEVKDLVSNEYEVIGKYINTGTKIEMKHNVCGHKYPVTPNKFLSGRRCPQCAIKIRAEKQRKTHEQFIKEVYERVGNEYDVLGEYIGDNIKIEMKHNVCGSIYPALPTNFLRGVRCPKCFGTPKKSTEEFKKEAFDLVGGEYEVLEEYADRFKKIKFRHNVCKSEYEVSPGNFLKGRRCPECFGNIKRTTESFKEEVYELVGEEYKVLGEYNGADTKINMKHNLCNYVWGVTPSHFLKDSSRCPKCFGLVKKTHEEFAQEVFKLVGDEYEIIGEYISSNKHIEMKHNECGHRWNVFPSNFIKKKKPTRCPNCNSTNNSKGEERISDWLDSKNVNYEQQYRFADCKDKYPLPFDFAIFHNDEIIALTEYDGEQHFKPIDWFGGEGGLKETQRRDKIKRNYCNIKNIPLLRIPYWEFDNIEDILKTTLLHLIDKSNE
ncbi:hypothetical protein LHV56_12485 [Peribacillus frigoritolerans]|uniref:hypothetical protein n=1 Tax=Peribacillus frigoritolerans TaxID=450367 RepID=UPI00207984EA|nr:hypothetical protein [Peribacillus frigoritolerans]USK82636.1 hypothetical protein LHV56_12485 [Peribacillus frigoritolerans]